MYWEILRKRNLNFSMSQIKRPMSNSSLAGDVPLDLDSTSSLDPIHQTKKIKIDDASEQVSSFTFNQYLFLLLTYDICKGLSGHPHR